MSAPSRSAGFAEIVPVALVQLAARDDPAENVAAACALLREVPLHANFYLANGVALVPTFGASSDERALAVLRELLEGRHVVGIPCRDVVLGLGAVHCLTQQEPL